MRKSLITSIFLVLVILIAACGQKEEMTFGENGDYYYTTFAVAESDAAKSGRHMVLDFYTDW